MQTRTLSHFHVQRYRIKNITHIVVKDRLSQALIYLSSLLVLVCVVHMCVLHVCELCMCVRLHWSSVFVTIMLFTASYHTPNQFNWKCVVLQHTFSHNLVEKVKWNVNRDSPEDKLRDFMEWMKAVKKETGHQVCVELCRGAVVMNEYTVKPHFTVPW